MRFYVPILIFAGGDNRVFSMKPIQKAIICAAISCLPAFARADWGLSREFIVGDCQTKAVGKCESFRGRSQKTNGSAATVIWKIGTSRIVALGSATKAANDVIKDKMDFNHTLYADFVACPMEKDIPKHRISYCVAEIKNARWVKSEN